MVTLDEARSRQAARSMTALRTRRRRSDSRLTRRQVIAAHRLYWDGGMTGVELARKLGYRDSSSLYRAFALHGLRVRTKSEAAKLLTQNKTCASCGCPVDDRTPGCGSCASRHHYRRTTTPKAVTVRKHPWKRPNANEPRTRCVYCGEKKRADHGGVACYKHRDLPALDPKFNPKPRTEQGQTLRIAA